MKRIAALAALLLVTASAEASEIVVNGGFESGDLTGWYSARALTNNPPGVNWFADSFIWYSGNWSAETGDNYELRQDFAPVLVTDIAHIKFAALTTSGGPMAFDLFYQGGVDQEFVVTPPSGLSLSLIDITSYLDLSQAALTGISFWGNTGGFAYLDAVSIQTKAAPPPPAVPEPLTLALVGAGLAGLGALRRRKA